MELLSAITGFLDETSTYLAPATISSYRRTLLGLANSIGDTCEVDEIQVSSTLSWLASRSLSAVTFRKEVTILKRFAKWLFDQDATRRHLLLTLPRPRGESRKRQGFSSVELQQLFKVLSQSGSHLARRDSLLFHILSVTGLRRAEVLNLRWMDLDLETNTLHLLDSKSRKSRNVALPDDLRLFLGEMRSLATGPWMIHGCRAGMPLSSRQANQRLRFWLAKAGIRHPMAGLHCFRIWFATMAYQLSHDVVLVSGLLGHRDLRPTLRYVSSASPNLQTLLNRISASLCR